MAKPTLSEISKLFKTDDKPTDFHYYGTVVSADTDNRTYEVSINRDKNITVEAARLVGAHVGDTVMVTVMANGYATVTGRVGGDTDASDAQRKADGASDIADKARAKAVSALSKATAAEQLANQAEQNAKRSADAAELAEENAGKSADYASESKTASEQAQQAAETAQQNAAASQTASETAQQNAAGSQTAAEAARDRAAVAEGYADTAQKQAAKAEKEASAANSYAVGALNSLSTTQDIMGVLSWVEESIKYVWDYPPTVEDKEYDPSKQYYTVIGKRVIDPIETDYDKYYVLNSESEPASKTGNIVTFDSDLDNFPLKSLTATINPKQDLHGYDKPWVGGAGKNKLPPTRTTTISGVTYTVASDGVISLTGTATAENGLAIPFTVTETGNYYFNGCADGGGYNSNFDCYLWDITNGRRAYKWDGTTTSESAINSSQSREIRLENGVNYQYRIRVRNGFATSGQKFYPMVRLATESDATFEPYSNICPISGWDSVNLYKNGKNLLDVVGRTITSYGGVKTIRSEGGTASKDGDVVTQVTSGVWSKLWFGIDTSMLKVGQSFTFSATIDNPSGNRINIGYRKGSSWTKGGTDTTETHVKKSITFTPDSSLTNFYFAVYTNNTNAATNATVTVSEIQLELGSTATAYEPYQADTYTTDLPETVYGGSLDVVNGVLTVDRAMVDLGTLEWTVRSTGTNHKGWSANLPSPYITVSASTPELKWLTSVYPYISGATGSGIATYGADSYSIGIYHYVTTRGTQQTPCYAITDANASPSGQLVYELAEPRTIQLTPKQVTTLLGTNNVWSDSGDVTVEYWDGPVGYVTPTSSFDPTETYYTVKGSPVKIDESKQEEHGKGLYYVHDLTNAKEAMADFIKAHLALTGEGLYVLKGLNDWRVLVANDGVYIIDPQGRRVASYKDSIMLGTSEGNSIRITSEAITFNIGDKTFAYVAQDKWFASNAEVSGAMYIGDYSLRQKSNGDFVLGRRR